MSTSLLDEIISKLENPEKVKIKDKFIIEELIQKIIDDGTENLQVVADFDMTLTRYHKDGLRCETCHGILDYSPLMPKDLKEKNKLLRDLYYPIEIDHNKTIEEKIPFMVEWYEKSHLNLSQTQFHKSLLKKLIAQSRALLRDNTDKMFKLLNQAKLPVLIFSAGIGDMVEEVLRSSELLLDNVKIISNYMIFDEDDKMIGFKEPLIHMYNKNETSLHHSEYFNQLAQRHNAILIGDSLGDIQMCTGIPNHGTILKIGFLNDKIPERLDTFMKSFDIVLVDDQSMDFVNLLFNLVLKLQGNNNAANNIIK